MEGAGHGGATVGQRVGQREGSLGVAAATGPGEAGNEPRGRSGAATAPLKFSSGREVGVRPCVRLAKGLEPSCSYFLRISLDAIRPHLQRCVSASAPIRPRALQRKRLLAWVIQITSLARNGRVERQGKRFRGQRSLSKRQLVGSFGAVTPESFAPEGARRKT